jgi:suppressor of ftsI
MVSRFFVALAFAIAGLAGAGAAQASPLAHMPEVRSQNGIAQLTLTAVQNAKTGLPAFSYNGGLVPPTIRVNPGDRIELLYVNALPTPVHQSFTNMTNLHFHGLKTSPHAPGDDTITIMIMPGQSYQYVVAIPKDESPGLYWYHTHPCGETNRQASGGMSGLIVVNGIEKYYPAVAQVPERLLIMRDAYPQGEPVPAARSVRARTQSSAICTGPGSEVVSLNGTYRPSIGIRPGETQFWRFANASANTFVDIKVDGAQLGVIARDGEPIVFRDPSGRGVVYNDYLVPPAGRVEFFVTGPHYATAKFRTLCVDTGPVGDIAPNRVLADLSTQDPARDALVPGPEALQPTRKPARDIRSFAISDTKTIVFTENKPSGIYMINGQRYDPTKPAHYFARVGTVEAWTVVNETPELHAFHIHQLHFLVYDPQAPAPAGTPLDFQDTVTVPYAKVGRGRQADSRRRSRADGFHRPDDQGHVHVPLPHHRTRGRRHDGKDRGARARRAGCESRLRLHLGINRPAEFDRSSVERDRARDRRAHVRPRRPGKRERAGRALLRGLGTSIGGEFDRDDCAVDGPEDREADRVPERDLGDDRRGERGERVRRRERVGGEHAFVRGEARDERERSGGDAFGYGKRGECREREHRRPDRGLERSRIPQPEKPDGLIQRDRGEERDDRGTA